jgi:hypothetical protein
MLIAGDELIVCGERRDVAICSLPAPRVELLAPPNGSGPDAPPMCPRNLVGSRGTIEYDGNSGLSWGSELSGEMAAALRDHASRAPVRYC